ncbi:MAG TPA: helix-turn-helix domain-containing protein [Terriglobales bacterium]|nr:helix-turn-helix domain-containing protein [Terriglobales bacterium]
MDTSLKPQLLDPLAAAEFLGLDSAGTLAVWRCTKRYDLPYIKVGHKIMYDVADLLAFLESRKVRKMQNSDVSPRLRS